MNILREFLYVDPARVRSMLAQLDGAVAEDLRSTQREDKRLEGGIRGYASRQTALSSEEYVNKSLGDSLFPSLETALEVHDLLTDISDELRSEDRWEAEELHSAYPPGTLVRITAPGSLFDARYVAQLFAGFGTTVLALQEMGIAIPPPGNSAPAARNKGQGQQARNNTSRETKPVGEPMLEDAIPDFESIDSDGEQDVTGKFLRSIIKIARAVFTPGLHLNLAPTGSDRNIVGIRLQEGRQYLDSDAEILFARYGTVMQNWTVVGTIGHFPPSPMPIAPEQQTWVDNNVVSRFGMSVHLNALLRHIGQLGFADSPQYYGFPIVPLAVYRPINPTQIARGNDLSTPSYQ